MTSLKVVVLVLTYNGLDFTRQCLATLRCSTYTPAEVWVLDNASTDGTPAAVQAEFPEVTLLEAPGNLGYAGGNNFGMRAALAYGADLIFLLNNDTLVEPETIATLVHAQQTRPRAGLLGPMVYTFDAGRLISSAGGQVDWRHADAVNAGMGQADTSQYSSRPVDFINGCGLLVSRDAVERAGMLDERFFMYWEETDWGQRIWHAGFEVYFVAEAHLRHNAPIHHQVLSPTVLYYVTRNRLLFMARHAPWPQKPLVVMRAVRGVWRGIGLHRQAGRVAHARATQRALRDALLGRWGQVDPRQWGRESA